MARQARKISSTGYYHIVMRGNNKDYIFRNKEDKVFFMETLFALQSEGLFSLAAWCLMDNHVHLALKGEVEDISLGMSRLNIRYAMRYHLKHKSIGHVFQDRFASEVIETDVYLMNVIRYVHRNPVKAKMVDGCRDYEWSSYGLYVAGLGGDGVGSGPMGTGPAVHQGRDHHDRSPSVPSVLDGVGEFPSSLTSLTEGSGYEFGLSMFSSLKAFVEFHKVDDYGDYLEIKEDRDKYRLDRGQQLIGDFCRRYGIVEGQEIRQNQLLFTELIGELEEKSGLSLRSIAKLLEMPYSSLQGLRRK